VRNVLACDCVYEGSDIGIRLKSNASRGGVVENIYCRNITMRDIRGNAIQIESDYGAWLASENGTNYPIFRNLHLQDVVCEGAQAAASIRGVPQQPVRNLTLENVSIRARTGMRFDWVHGLRLDRVACAPSSGEPFSFENCQDVVREPDR
jgi:polygalacturonase